MIQVKKDNVDYEIEVDVMEELNPYDWNRARIKPDEMVSCSPFRNDGSPSFSINLTTGLWIDFGSDDYMSKGNLTSLLSFLRNETPNEVDSYLLDKYGIDLSDITKLSLNIDFNIETKVDTVISTEVYQQYAYRSPYLATRGISEKVQRAFKVGYDKKGKAIALAWTDIKGNIVNIKFRSVNTKRFYYYPTGQAIRNHIFGMHFVYKMKCERVFLVESEIDALYMWSNGLPAIALGGSNISDKQKQLIQRSPIKDLVIATDNDRVGREIREKVIKAFIGYKELHDLDLPESVKDVNELEPTALKELAKNTTPVSIVIF